MEGVVRQYFRYVLPIFNHELVSTALEIVGIEYRTFTGMIQMIFYTLGYMLQSGIGYRWRNWHEFVVSPYFFYTLS